MSISQSHEYMFEMTIDVVLYITFREKKTYVQDVLDDVVTGVSKRTVQKYLASLEKIGYIVGDKKQPQGFLPTEKSRELFGAK